MTAQGKKERLVETDKLIAITVLVLAILVIAGIFIYLNIDSKRFAARRLLLEMRPDLENWLLTAEDLMKRETDEALQKEYHDLCASIGSAKIKELEKMTGTVNRIHRSLKRTVADNIEDSAVKEKAYELSECFSGFVYERTVYNERISEVNRYIVKEPSSWVAKLLHMKVFETLDDLTIM